MCGSGTFLTEAALIAGDAAPALDREYFGFLGWRGHDAALWERLRAEARARRAARTPRRCIVGLRHRCGCGAHGARERAQSAGVAEWMHVEKRALDAVVPPRGPAGLVVANPPYGERIGAESGLPELYAELGRVLRERFHGWQAAILTGNPPLARHLGIYAKRTHRVFNGDHRMPAVALRLERDARAAHARGSTRRLVEPARRTDVRQPVAQESRAPRALGGDGAHRVLPGVRRRHAGVRVRHRPVRSRAAARLRAGIRAAEDRRSARARASAAAKCWRCCRRCLRCRSSASIPACASRRRATSSTRSAALDRRAARAVQRRAGLEFWVNFRDYLDTGLFLDHRIVRGMLREWARDADFLNLFCYTGSATVYAAAGGARSSVSVDLSNTYLDWAHDNLRAQRLRGPRARAATAPIACEWLDEQEAARGAAVRSDLPRSADFLEFQAHGGRARRAARSRRDDPARR